MHSRHPWTRWALAVGLVAASVITTGCPRRDERPNVLWIVWDTVRADRLGPYGHSRPTTPNLDRWVHEARVFEDALSTASYTLPSHASMFTGLLPSEHCAHNGTKQLDDRFETIAELLQRAGYATFLYSANPHISAGGNFTQGFEVARHPWSPEFQQRALEIVRVKLEDDRSSELNERLDSPASAGLAAWNIKAAGELAEEATSGWLGALEDDRPWFAFLNYMEAHRPLIPPRRFREAVMDPAQVEASYRVDRTWDAMWAYTFRLREYTEQEIELTNLTYDAAVRELDELFGSLLERLDNEGFLENTIVILTADHGEHLGEQHMFDHQYTTYQPALRVPLVLHYPGHVPAGRDARPVMNFDLFPTVLELTGVEPPPGLRSHAVSLLTPDARRVRFAEEPSESNVGLDIVRRSYPDFDATPWQRRLRALVDGQDKFVWASDGRHEWFDLGRDPGESVNLLPTEPERARQLEDANLAYYGTLASCDGTAPDEPNLTSEERERLKSLGYLK
jgi:arylsulfatase A-like enzyme